LPYLIASEAAVHVSSCCSSFWAANQRQFSDVTARRDLERYRTRGPDATTRLLRDAILRAGNGKTVLDVGAGIGALSFELLAAVGIQNLARALFGNPFRGFVHSARAMDALLEQHGFSRTERRQTLKWSADLYVRARP